MALTVNDLSGVGCQLRTTTGNAVVTGRCRILAVWITSGGNDSDIVIYDNTTQTGADAVQVRVGSLIGTDRQEGTGWLYFGPMGLQFTTGLSVTVTGAGAAAGVAYIPE